MFTLAQLPCFMFHSYSLQVNFLPEFSGSQAVIGKYDIFSGNLPETSFPDQTMFKISKNNFIYKYSPLVVQGATLENNIDMIFFNRPSLVIYDFKNARADPFF